MLSLFQRKRPADAGGAIHPNIAKGWMRPQSAASLLAAPRRQRLLTHIWQRTSLSRRQFAALYLEPLERYAALVQQFPASESHHHAYPGGMLDHGLEIVAYALKLRQAHLLPAGASPEAQAAQAEAWTAGVAYAALVHDIGKIAVDLDVELDDGSTWHPWHGPFARPYRFRYRPDREYRLHGAAGGLLYHRILHHSVLDWLSGYPDLWAALLYVMAGQHEHAGVLGELVTQADQASVAQELGGNPAKALAAPRHALQRKLLDGLRHLVKEVFRLNQPQASDGWLTQDALWLVSKTVSDKLRAHLLSQGIEGIPSSNTAVFDVLQDHGVALPTLDGKAIWRATVTSDAGWSNSFTFLKLSPALIWDAEDRPAAFAGTVAAEQESQVSCTPPNEAMASSADSPPELLSKAATPAAPRVERATLATEQSAQDAVSGLLDLMARTQSEDESQTIATNVQSMPKLPDDAVEPVPTTAPSASKSATHSEFTPSGEHFMLWLRQGIRTRRLIINDAKALVHTVADTAYLVSPGVFQRYAQEHPQIMSLAKQEQLSDWQWVQKRFEKMKLHRKQNSGLNIWTCEVTGPRKSRRLHGYLLNDPGTLVEESQPNNPYLTLYTKTYNVSTGAN